MPKNSKKDHSTERIVVFLKQKVQKTKTKKKNAFIKCSRMVVSNELKAATTFCFNK